MKANEFVKKFGSKSAKYWIDHFNNVNTLPDEFINTEFLDDLKRLVKSHDLVESYDGLFEAKIYADSEYRSLSAPQITKRLKQAIEDVESCL